MKNLKKALVLLLCAILLVAGSVMGTLAYLTSQSTAVNTFTVGDVVIYLDETDIDNSETKYGYDALLNDGRDLYNAYTGDNKLIPGRTVTKDPTVWVKEDSEPCYIRMNVTVGAYDQLSAALSDDYKENNMVVLSKLVKGWNYDTWEFKACTVAADGKSAVYEFRYYPTNGIFTANDDSDNVVEYNELPELFAGVVIPGTIDNAHMKNLADVTITVDAQAIQSEGFATADAAWTAFDQQTATP